MNILTQNYMQTIKSQFAPMITRLRKKAGYTQEQVAVKLNLTRSAYAAYEESRREPGLETLNNLLKLYGKPTLDSILKI